MLRINRHRNRRSRPLGDDPPNRTAMSFKGMSVAPSKEQEDEAVEKVNAIWRQKFEDDPEGALDELGAKVKELGRQLAYAGRTFGAPIAERTYYIIDPDENGPIAHSDDGNFDLTVFDACLWSELALKKWNDRLFGEGAAHARRPPTEEVCKSALADGDGAINAVDAALFGIPASRSSATEVEQHLVRPHVTPPVDMEPEAPAEEVPRTVPVRRVFGTCPSDLDLPEEEVLTAPVPVPVRLDADAPHSDVLAPSGDGEAPHAAGDDRGRRAWIVAGLALAVVIGAILGVLALTRSSGAPPGVRTDSESTTTSPTTTSTIPVASATPPTSATSVPGPAASTAGTPSPSLSPAATTTPSSVRSPGPVRTNPTPPALASPNPAPPGPAPEPTSPSTSPPSLLPILP
jgi:hypothetical protein